MKKWALMIIALGFMLYANSVFAEDVNYSGTYTMKGPEDVITLTLQQDKDGNVIGTLSSTTGLSFKVEGILSEGFAVGACYNDEMGVFFEAGFEGEKLIFMLIEPDENNKPNYDKTTELSFTRSSDAAPKEPDSKVPPSLRGKLTGEADKDSTPSKKTDEKDKKTDSKKSHIADSSEIGEGEIGDKSWGFKFKAPKDWVHQVGPDSVMLGHNTIAGILLVVTHNDEPFEKMKAEFADGIEEEGISLKLVGELKKIDDLTISGTFEGVADNTNVKAYSIATMSPFGGSGAYIVALTTPEQFKPELTGRVDEIFNTLKFFKVDISEQVKNLAGKWTTVTTNTETSYYLYADGTFSRDYEANYWDTSGGGGGPEWGANNREQNTGKWKVKGNAEKGVMTLIYNNGNEEQIEYAVHVEGGETYWNEYYFNGDLYSRGTF